MASAFVCFVVMGCVSVQSAFLEDALPLKIDATIPRSLLREDDGEAIQFSGRSTITVVFSRAVIALGTAFGEEDIPDRYLPFSFADEEVVVGRGRWVTTSVFRWDPQGQWHTDVQTELIWNRNLTTYDGVKLDLTNVTRRVPIQTASLRGTLVGVASVRALGLTDEHWDGRLGLEDDNLPEFPPDGAMVIEFQRRVNLPSLQESVELYRLFDEQGRLRERIDKQVRVRTCVDLNESLVNARGGPKLDSCAIIDFVEPFEIERDELHGLVIPRGWVYNEGVDGPLREEILFEFYGLRRFRLPFETRFRTPNAQSDVVTQYSFESAKYCHIHPTSFHVVCSLSSANLTLWLPHGLADGITVGDLKSAIQLQQFPWDAPGTVIEIDYDLVRGDRGTLFMTAEFGSAQRYKLFVSGRGDIRDGFGLPLEAGEIEFPTSRLSTVSVLVAPAMAQLFSQSDVHIHIDGTDDDWDGEIPFLVRRPEFHQRPTVRVWSLLPENEEELKSIAFAMRRLFNAPDEFRRLTLGKEPIFELDLPPETLDEPAVSMIPLEQSLKESRGMLLVQSPGVGPKSRAYSLVRDMDFQLVSTHFGHKDRRGRFRFDVVILVTSVKTGEALRNVNITVMRRVDEPFSRLSNDEETELETITRLTTDADGVARYKSPPCNSLGRCSDIIYWVESDTRSVFITDSLSYFRQEGFGYNNEAALVFDRRLVEPGDTLHLAGFLVSREDSFEVRPFGQNPSDENISIVISPSFDPSAEGFETLEIPVEIDEEYGTFQVEIDIPSNAPRGSYFIQQPFFEGFIVGEPRVLTAEVVISNPPWVRPNRTFEVTVTIASLLGVPIADAEFTLTWGSASEGNVESVDLTTNATGQSVFTVDLSKSENPIQPGDSIEIEVRFIGPTREPIFERTSVPVSLTALFLDIETSLDNPVPGLTEFGVSVNVRSRDFGRNEVHRIEVELLDIEDTLDVQTFTDSGRMVESMLEMREDADIVVEVVDNCALRSDQSVFEMYGACRFVLPDIGHYALRACVEFAAQSVCDVLFVGKNITEWEADPLREHPGIALLPERQQIERNAVAELFVDLPFENVRAVLMWGNELESNHEIFRFRSPGLHQITFLTQEECVGGCEVRMSFSMPRQDIALPVDVPTAFDFEVGLPTSDVRGTSISILDEDVPFTLLVELQSNRSIVTPGSNTSIEMVVQKCAGNPNLVDPASCSESVPARDVELVVIGVDKAFLELESNPLLDLVDLLDLDWNEAAFGRVLGNDWLSSGFFQKALEFLLEVNEVNPWQLSRLISFAGPNQQEIVSQFSQILDQYRESEAITIAPPGLSRILAWFGRELQQAPDPPSMPSGRSTDSVEEGEEPDLRLQTDFKVTPLFTVVKTDDDGKANVTFTAPDNVGTFVIRAYGSSLDAQHGSTEIELINRLPVTLTPSAPRFVRIGDQFEAGVIVTLAVEEREGVSIRVTLLGDPSDNSSIVYNSGDGSPAPDPSVDEDCDETEDLSCLVVLERQEFESDVDGQVEVRFAFDAVRIGEGNITLRADAIGESDALQISIPVFGQQESVVIATSFAINPEEAEATAEEGLELPDAVPGSGSLELLAGVGKFPAVLEIAEGFLSSTTRPLIAVEALANITLPFIFQGYGLDTSPENRQLYRRAIAAFDMGITSLNTGNLTNRGLGLQWSISSRPFFFDGRPDVLLNAFGVRIVNILVDGLQTNNRVLRRGLQRLETLSAIWRRRMIRQLISDAEDFVDGGSIIPRFVVLHVLQALGADWEMPICPAETACTSPPVADSLSLDRILNAFDDNRLGTGDQIALASILLETEGEAARERPEVQRIVGDLFDRIRTIARTAYVAQSPESSTPIGSLDQVEAFRVFIRSGTALDNTLIEKLSNNIASGNTGTSVFSSRSTVVDIVIMLALLEYDQLTGSSDVDLSLAVRSGTVTLLEAEFTSPSDPVANASVLFNDLDDPPSPLVFSSEGTGEVTLTASLTFIPAELLPFPTFNGLYVERIIRESDANGDPIGEPLKTIPLASTAVITLQITTPDDLSEVTVRALMPGGLEPIDPLTTESSSTVTTCELDDLNIRFQFWYWPLCPTQETRPSEVTFTYSRLRAGTHAINFRAIAASVGDWILPPIQAFVTSQPEVMGLSVAGEFTVCDGADCEAESAEDRVVIPENCPGDCNGTGVCDVTTGECRCDVGYSGLDCATIVET